MLSGPPSNRGVAVLARLKGECKHGCPIRGRCCAMRHLLRAARMEFAKLERPFSHAEVRGHEGGVDGDVADVATHHGQLRQPLQFDSRHGGVAAGKIGRQISAPARRVQKLGWGRWPAGSVDAGSVL
jgi:hypothetical protein